MRALFPAIVLLLMPALSYQGAGANPGESPGFLEQDPVKISSTDFHGQSTWLLGYIDPDRFTRPPHNEWFLNGFDEYNADSVVLGKLRETLPDGLSIKVVLGTWCPDSRREVPRFMKITGLLGVDQADMTFIGVDDAKISPVGEYEELGIERVPTFIFYKNNVEAGRIIENPVSSLEQDMLDILTGNKK